MQGQLYINYDNMTSEFLHIYSYISWQPDMGILWRQYSFRVTCKFK